MLIITNTSYSFFAPPICLAARHVMSYMVPGLAMFAVIFSYSSPLAVSEVRPPFFPACIFKPGFLGVHSGYFWESNCELIFFFMSFHTGALVFQSKAKQE